MFGKRSSHKDGGGSGSNGYGSKGSSLDCSSSNGNGGCNSNEGCQETVHFKVKMYTKKELALCYFPSAVSPHTAVNHLMSWINRCTPLREALEGQGYRKTSKWFSPREVRLIIEYLGEP